MMMKSQCSPCPVAERSRPRYAVLVVIAVGDGALVLHAEVRRLDELVAVLVPGERAEPVLEALEHRLHLLELLAGGVEVIVERIEVERELASLALVYVAEMRVVRGVDGDVVVVDRIGDEPLVGRGPIRVRRRAPQPAVRDIDQRIRDGDRDALAVGLVGVDILVRPPDTGAGPFVGGRYPGAGETVTRPHEAAVPRRAGATVGLP